MAHINTVLRLAAEPGLYNAAHALGAQYRAPPAWQVTRIARALENTNDRETTARLILNLRDVLTAYEDGSLGNRGSV